VSDVRSEGLGNGSDAAFWTRHGKTEMSVLPWNKASPGAAEQPSSPHCRWRDGWSGKETLKSKIKSERKGRGGSCGCSALLADTHRVISNGLTFKVQVRTTRGWLRKREVWEDLGRNITIGCFIPTHYSTIGEAQKICDQRNHEDAMRHEWRPVSANKQIPETDNT